MQSPRVRAPTRKGRRHPLARARPFADAGLTVGWGWSRHECGTCTDAGWNTIAYNRVHGYKQALNDGGGIYMLGPQVTRPQTEAHV